MISHTEESSHLRPAVDTVETLAALRAVPAVRDAVVTGHAGADGRTVTVGYVTGPDPARGTAWIRQHLLGLLPDYLIPEQLFVLDRLPLTAEGDYDLGALPAPEGDNGPADSYVAPRTPTEQQLADIVKELLGIGRVGVYDSFFGLGGSSIQATRLTSKLRETFDVDLPLRDVFASPTVDGLAQIVVRIHGLPDDDRRRVRRQRRRERAFRYVVGHPALVAARRQAERLLPGRG